MRPVRQKPLLIFKSLTFCAVVVMAFGCGNGGLSTINIKASVEFAIGGPRPLARADMYLLNKSIASPEMEEALKVYLAANPQPVNPVNPNHKSMIGTREGFMRSEGKKIWHKYVVAMTGSSHSGTAKFKQVKAGDYWIYCSVMKPNGEFFIWNVKTKVDFYETISVKLNNDNITFH